MHPVNEISQKSQSNQLLTRPSESKFSRKNINQMKHLLLTLKVEYEISTRLGLSLNRLIRLTV